MLRDTGKSAMNDSPIHESLLPLSIPYHSTPHVEKLASDEGPHSIQFRPDAKPGESKKSFINKRADEDSKGIKPLGTAMSRGEAQRNSLRNSAREYYSSKADRKHLDGV